MAITVVVGDESHQFTRIDEAMELVEQSTRNSRKSAWPVLSKDYHVTVNAS